jgi:hypothetical protein
VCLLIIRNKQNFSNLWVTFAIFLKTELSNQDGFPDETCPAPVEGPHQPVHRIQAAISGQVLDPTPDQDDDGPLLRKKTQLLQNRVAVPHPGSDVRNHQSKSPKERFQGTL